MKQFSIGLLACVTILFSSCNDMNDQELSDQLSKIDKSEILNSNLVSPNNDILGNEGIQQIGADDRLKRPADREIGGSSSSHTVGGSYSGTISSNKVDLVVNYSDMSCKVFYSAQDGLLKLTNIAFKKSDINVNVKDFTAVTQNIYLDQDHGAILVTILYSYKLTLGGNTMGISRLAKFTVNLSAGTVTFH